MKKWLVVLTIVSIFMGSQKVVKAVAVTGACEWCGATCQRTTVGQMCMDVAPPVGKICVEENGVCVIKNSVTVSPTVAKTSAGEAYLSVWPVNSVDESGLGYDRVDLVMHSNTMVQGADIWLSYDSEIWQLMKVEPLSQDGDKFVYSFNKDMVKIDNKKGIVSVQLNGTLLSTLSQAQVSTTYKQPLLRFSFKPIKSGTHLIDIICQNGVDTDTNIFDTEARDIINCSKNVPFGGSVILPIVTDTVIPTQGQVGCVKSEGDASGDEKVDLVDFGIWKSEYLATIKAVQSKADFNCDGKVDLVDFGIWKSEYLKN